MTSQARNLRGLGLPGMGDGFPEPPENPEGWFERLGSGYPLEERDEPSLLNTLDILRQKCKSVAERLRSNSRGGAARRTARALRLSTTALARAARQTMRDAGTMP